MKKSVKDNIVKLYNFVDGFVKMLNANRVNAYSAQSAFFIIIAFFPFIMLVITLIQYLPVSHDEISDILFSLFPGETSVFMKNMMLEINVRASGTLISVTAVSTLWSASSGVFALMRGINSVYAYKETRSHIRRKASSVIYTVMFILMLIATMGVLVFGNTLQSWIEEQFPDLIGAAAIVISLRTIIGIFVLTVFSLVLYVVVPNRKTQIRDELPGAVISAVGWVLYSYIYSFYITNWSNKSYFYGSMTAIVFLMLWLYFCMYIMLVGAQINVLIQKRKI